MTEIICQTTDLCKSYKNFHALQNVNLSINRGEIYGLIGENGAGKSTLIRILTGLAFPSGGVITLFGKTQNLQQERSKIGCTIEMPALYQDMTAQQNLEIQRVQRGIPDRKCIYKALENVGLDPTGIIELRELLKKLVRENQVTILISSHILSELNQLATCYGFLHHGKLLKQISAKALGEECRRHIKLKTDHTKRTVTILEEQLQIKNFSIYPDDFIRIYEKLEEAHTISKTLSACGIVILELSVQGEELETYFENLIGGSKDV